MGLEDVAKRRPKLDSFNKFGVNLFLAGACETAGLASNLSENEISQILNEGVQILNINDGNKKVYNWFIVILSKILEILQVMIII